MDCSGMSEQCRLHMPTKTSTKEPKGATLSNTTCFNTADEGHLRALLSLRERDRIKIDTKVSRPSLFIF